MIEFSTRSGAVLVGDEFGRPDAPAVVLLHGGGQTRHSWHGTAEVLADAGFHTLALDARGHGDSGWSDDGDYSLGRLADDLREVTERLAGPVALVGASLGGLTSVIAAGEDPRLDCSGLVLVDVVPRMDPVGRKAIVGFMTARPDGFASLAEAADAIAAYLPHRPRPRSTAGLAKNLRRSADGRYRWHWDPRFLAGADGSGPDRAEDGSDADRFSEDRLERALDAVTAPVLLVRGRQSDLLTDEYVELFRARHPGVQIAEVGGARHMVAGDVNDAFTSAVGAFLTRTAHA